MDEPVCGDDEEDGHGNGHGCQEIPWAPSEEEHVRGEADERHYGEDAYRGDLRVLASEKVGEVSMTEWT